MAAPADPVVDEIQSEISGPLGFLKQILRSFRPHWLRFTTIMLMILAQVTFFVLMPVAFRLIFDRAVEGKDSAFLEQMLILLLAGFVLVTLLELLQSYLAITLAGRVMNTIRLEMFTHLQRLPFGFYARTKSGDLISHFSNDLNAVDQTMAIAIYKIVHHTLVIAASTVLLFVFEWRLALFSLIALPLGAAGPRLFGPRANAAGDDRKQDEAAVLSGVQENIAAQKTVRAFGLQTVFLEQFRTQLDNLYDSNKRMYLFSAYIEKTSGLGILLLQLLVICLGAYLVIQEYLSQGTFLGFIAILVNVGGSAKNLTAYVPNLIQASSGMRRIRAFLEEPGEGADPEDAAPGPAFNREIRFKDVTFSYTGKDINLDRIELTISAGQSVAFVGPSGSGKSTVLNLIARFYDPSEGVITIDGQDLKSIRRAALQERIGTVFQDTFLFNTSVRDNIRLGKLGATNEQVEAAARAAEIHDFLISLPEGYDTGAGEMGGRLSGGQRQRIALARALLRDPPILILDEATSALDPATEAAINTTLEDVGRGRTVISVTHRLASVAGADRIFVLDRGRVVEQGTHEALLARGGLYLQLWEKQSGFTTDEDGASVVVTADRLHILPILERLEPSLLEEITVLFVTERYAANQIVVQQGDPGDRFYVIVRGSVEILRTDANGEEDRIALLEDGDHFGEIALLKDVPRTATVRTLTPCTFLSLQQTHFSLLVDRSPRVRQILEECLRERMRVDKQKT